ncbi:MAG: DNA-binding protein HU [uncultured Campylobacterales bacterium]|uniref:DNA-binding protein HU n=1 Tax=uncultured Campylobacterales bacterium TaxID=352960 RepID=A0A6S6T818_9BACT|nr:MAG: DNA-binding protein HU [uncultured Campylobacterales bacterium]
MNKTELVNEVASQTNISKKDVTSVVDSVLETIGKSLSKKENVALIGFGTFSTSDRAARTAKVPGTGKEVQVAATTVAKFKPGKALKEQVAKSK